MCSIPEINQALIGEALCDGLSDGQPADAGIKYADGLLGCSSLSQSRVKFQNLLKVVNATGVNRKKQLTPEDYQVLFKSH